MCASVAENSWPCNLNISVGVSYLFVPSDSAPIFNDHRFFRWKGNFKACWCFLIWHKHSCWEVSIVDTGYKPTYLSISRHVKRMSGHKGYTSFYNAQLVFKSENALSNTSELCSPSLSSELSFIQRRLCVLLMKCVSCNYSSPMKCAFHPRSILHLKNNWFPSPNIRIKQG